MNMEMNRREFKEQLDNIKVSGLDDCGSAAITP